MAEKNDIQNNICVIDDCLLDSVSKKAKESPRLRMNYNFHSSESDSLNRLLNAVEPGTYVRPHRHLNPDKEEIILVLRGSVESFVFDDNGNVIEKIVISPEKGCYGMEIKPGLWHSLFVTEPDTILYEIKRGPYAPLSPDNFASWSPDGSDPAETGAFLARIRSEK